MNTADGKIAEGAIWYQSFPRDTECIGPDGMYSEKPINYDAGVEGVYFAVVMKQGLAPGHTLKVWSGNTETPAVYRLKAGLNYGSAEALNRGAQYLEILDPAGQRVAYASGGMCVAKSCPRGIHVRNYHVVGVEVGDLGATCTPWPREVDEPDPGPEAPPTTLPPTQAPTTTAGMPPPEETDGRTVKWLNTHNKLCLIYKDYPDKTEDCSRECKDDIEKAKEEHRTTSSACVGYWPGKDPIPWKQSGPGAYWVAAGHCTCDNSALNLIGDTFIEALPVIAEVRLQKKFGSCKCDTNKQFPQVGCFLIISSLKLVLDIAMDAIPESKSVTAPMGTLPP